MAQPAFAAVCVLLAAARIAAAADPSARFVYPGPSARLVYDADARGNRIPDFSHCGCRGGGVAIPEATVQVVVPPRAGDSTARIQAAIDHVARLPADERGLRGAVLLVAGRHEVAGQLTIHTSGIVLRGQGEGENESVLVATGTDRRTLIRVGGKADRRIVGAAVAVADSYVPVGTARLRLAGKTGLHLGDRVLVERPSPKAWISALGMDRFPTDDRGSWLDWQEGKFNLQWDRTITAIEGDSITLDAPLSTAIDQQFGGATVAAYQWLGRIHDVGIEHLRCESAFERANPGDEQHAWGAISLDHVENAWIRQVTAVHFAGSAVAAWEGARQITVEDCTSLLPVSEIGGYRRHTFYTCGQLTLFQRCRAEQGRHDFAVGYLAAGPNAFVECRADDAHQASGPIESWASGVLYDNVHVDGGGLALTNRETAGHGVGWAAANCVLWQCSAPVITCRAPPTAQNWAIGCWGEFVGDGHWRSMNEFVEPGSLYRAQLAERLGAATAANAKRRTIPSDPGAARSIDEIGSAPLSGPSAPANPPPKPVALTNGWLTIGGRPVLGGRVGMIWWRGHIHPSRAPEAGLGVTRFVPGREGPGYTDDLPQLAQSMRERGEVVLEHHWGLWYDRRRDDHQMIRRADGEVWPPFYEQPWARSGQGQAWDGLSKYDLTKFNPWYFSRLKSFADQCDRQGLVLVLDMYFQHNVLEAGAHWADFPWRPANCLQATGFPEPPRYVNNKRVFMAEAFYDVAHPLRRTLHAAYIRHCLDVLGTNTNVIFQIGEEFTGPEQFVRFWLETIDQWQRETGRRVLIGLSCTKDVQDAVLNDERLRDLIAVIDLKYWWYTATGELFAPAGGQNLAPRQQLRAWQGNKSRSDQQLARQVREYRSRYPDKAVISSLGPASGWATLAAGGSIANLPQLAASEDLADLLAALPRMRPMESGDHLGDRQWMVADPGRDYLVYVSGERARIDLSGREGPFAVRWLDVQTNRVTAADSKLPGGQVAQLTPPHRGPWVLWLSRDVPTR